jgi:hypothetical protein
MLTMRVYVPVPMKTLLSVALNLGLLLVVFQVLGYMLFGMH